MDTPSEDFIRTHGTEYTQIGATDSARWFVLDGVAYHSRTRGHMQLSQHVPGSETWKLHLVPVKSED